MGSRARKGRILAMPDLFSLENRAPSASPAALAALAARVTADEARIAALEAAPGAAVKSYSCPSGAAVRQLAYKTTVSGAVGIADAADPTKMDAIGFIAIKLTSTSCYLQSDGELAGFAGLTPGAKYYASATTPGGISTTAGDPDLGQVAQMVGTAKTAAILNVQIATPPEASP